MKSRRRHQLEVIKVPTTNKAGAPRTLEVTVIPISKEVEILRELNKELKSLRKDAAVIQRQTAQRLIKLLAEKKDLEKQLRVAQRKRDPMMVSKIAFRLGYLDYLIECGENILRVASKLAASKAL